ncbi:alpha/beta fold hydrolase [Ilumatobacter sp.]|uniref:alpha/beta fold hydrolase n=1 Tax=Ilumatobacter sp. TaxID=1967498 RepID=UPI003B529B43
MSEPRTRPTAPQAETSTPPPPAVGRRPTSPLLSPTSPVVAADGTLDSPGSSNVEWPAPHPETADAPRPAPGAPPPWLPPGRIVPVAGRGEFFVRHHVHPDADAPTVLLLHGWTASADLQFIAAYRALAESYSFVAIDHRGHGRGLRTLTEFALEDAADDAAAVVRALGIDSVIAVGYSMGGPISMFLARRHPDLVAGLVEQATALEWRATLRERLVWRLLPFVGFALRSWTQPKALRVAVERMITDSSELAPYRAWFIAETMRNDAASMVEAGRALSLYDARDWARELGVPAGSLVATEDRLVRPKKQRQLATALDAIVVEVEMDHLGSIERPDQFASATVELVDAVASARSTPAGASASPSDST